MSQHLMLVPSLACPASCAYCFGPHTGTGTMSLEIVEAVVSWQRSIGSSGNGPNGDGPNGARPDEDRGDEGGREREDGAASQNGTLEITFHGGEPLVPGAKWYREALPLLRDGLAPRRVRFAAQSNLWLLTDELCELFREYGVALGTSLDGPEEINDAQRGRGYFAKTMAGIDRARAHGLDVGAICTFTAQTAARADEIFDFFVREGLNFSVHGALPSLRDPDADRWSLPAEAHGDLLVGLLDRYLSNLTRVRVGTLDSMARSVSSRRGAICTFGDCLGGYLAVGPNGSIYPCQRFAGMAEYAVGDVRARPSPADLEATPVWRMFAEREAHVAESCGDCEYLALCRGGCPYNVLVGSGGELAPSARDPHCEAYRRTFDAITERAMAEVFSPENMEAVVERPDESQGLLRRGPLLSIMRDGRHPYEAAARARRTLAAVALAATGSPAEAAGRFVALGLASDRGRVETAMASMLSRLTAPARGLNSADGDRETDDARRTNGACRACSLRYLCGDAGRAWSPAESEPDVDVVPPDCSHLHARARSLLVSALDSLEVENSAWLSAGLPIPDPPQCMIS